MSDEFRIDFVNSPDYKYLATEITFRHQRLCQMCRTDDGESIDIEFLFDDLLILKEPVRLKFPLADFLQFVEIARQELMNLPRSWESLPTE
jgi:hypothetical protein